MDINFLVVLPYWHVLLKGLLITIAFTLSCAVIGSLLGFLLSLLRLSSNPIVRLVTGLYVEFFRGTPLLIQLFWVVFCFPIVLGMNIPAYLAVVISLVFYMTAITSETFRSSLTSISKDQYDACVALSLTPTVKVMYVIFPQAVLRAIPPLLSNIVALFKESALISSVGVTELMFVGQNLSTSLAKPVEFLTITGLIYFFVAFPLTRLVAKLEKKILKRFA